MLTGFEALGAASAVLQVISFASDLAVACKNAYDGATTPQDDLQRHAKQMCDAVGRLQARCKLMNSQFSNPELQKIAQDCKNATAKLEAEVQYVTNIQAKGDIVKSIRRAFRASSHQKKLQELQESLHKYQQVMKTELVNHLCSQNDAIYLQQDISFHKLDTDVQFLIRQLAQGVTDVQHLVKQEHATTRNTITQEAARTESAINTHTDMQVLQLRTTVETKKQCETFLRSLKAPRMNQRYNDVMDSRDATFNQVFASYEDMIDMYYEDSDGSNSDGDDSKGDRSSGATLDQDDLALVESIHDSWASFNSWLQSDDVLFYIQGKPGSGKSTLMKFILGQGRTHNLVQKWKHDAIVISYFFWKIGSHEQNSIKGLWCCLLYQRLKDQQQLILSTLQQFNHLSQHTEYHDWSIKDLEAVWRFVADSDDRHMCIFIDGLDEIRNEDGFSKLSQSIQLLLKPPHTKLCVSTRPEAQIMRWLNTTNAGGIRLEDLTKFEMHEFVRKKFRFVLPNDNISSETFNKLRQDLVNKAQGVFLWLHLATRSIIEGIENDDAEDILLQRLEGLPGDLERLYVEMWQRLNANNPVYRETAARYFRYVVQGSNVKYLCITHETLNYLFVGVCCPNILQIAFSEDLSLQQTLLAGGGTVQDPDIIRMCDDARASICTRCAGLIETQPAEFCPFTPEVSGDQTTSSSDVLGGVTFIHRTAHDFLTDTEAGRSILEHETAPDSSLETRLLKGLICAVFVSQCNWGTSWHTDIIFRVVDLLSSWGRDALPSVTEMLDAIRPLYDKNAIFSFLPWAPQAPFFSHLVYESQLDDFVIARLTAQTSTLLATSVLREIWHSDANMELGIPSKRLFDALIALDANPHEYGEIWRGFTDIPFFKRGSAFTNLLMSFLTSTQVHYGRGGEELPRIGNDALRSEAACELLDMALYMAKDCQDLSATFALPAFPFESGRMGIRPLTRSLLAPELLEGRLTEFVIYEVNVHFLLLYLLSKVSGEVSGGVLADPQSQALLAKVNSPSVKIGYFGVKEERNPSAVMCKRVILHSPSLPRSVMEHLFDVDLKDHLKERDVSYNGQTDLDIISQHTKNLETEDVDYETMLVSLANENLGISTCEEAGMIPPAHYLRTFERLEAAAASREEREELS
ncbi:hypothetical protein FBEOM_8358 [Fusarium beomiforme]|uniref:NACHT domain-containing protein n=1 Tax=Fusarium beomiforme TaxID=44412 RepID=A0A9P5AFF8_9HYPO|nr:hypothetical protein FBEOM_8358 [Fusarium beomiforme]